MVVESSNLKPRVQRWSFLLDFSDYRLFRIGYSKRVFNESTFSSVFITQLGFRTEKFSAGATKTD